MNRQGQIDKFFPMTSLYLKCYFCLINVSHLLSIPQINWGMLSKCLRIILDIHWNDVAVSAKICQKFQ